MKTIGKIEENEILIVFTFEEVNNLLAAVNDAWLYSNEKDRPEMMDNYAEIEAKLLKLRK